MTTQEWLELYGLRALYRLEPASIEELIDDVRDQASTAGLLHPGELVKIDRQMIAVGMIARWERAEPPLAAQVDYEPDEVTPTGNVLPHAVARFELTEAGEAEMRRLERAAGVI